MRIAVLGAGIGGLASAYLLKKNGFTNFSLFEQADHVGGMARSFLWHGFDCDIAPHRLYTNNEIIRDEMLGLVPMHRVRRRSQILIQGKWIQDPVNAVEMVLKFLPVRSGAIVWHYLFRPKHPEDSFEALVLNQFGKGLNEMFFKAYSEKLFGIPADRISPVWGRNKIRVAGVKDMLRKNTKLYFDHFYYPSEHGYGAISERLYRDVQAETRLKTRLTAIRPDASAGGYRCSFESNGGTVEEHFDAVISSLPVTYLAGLLGFRLNLAYRPAKIAFLLIGKNRVTRNNWFYFADRDDIINRCAEFKNFALAPMPEDRTVLCCEVTRTEAFSLDAVVATLARRGLIQPDEVLDTKVIDLDQAYPIYDLNYENETKRIAEFARQFPHIHQIGRNAQFVHKDVDEIFDGAKTLTQKILADYGVGAS